MYSRIEIHLHKLYSYIMIIALNYSLLRDMI